MPWRVGDERDLDVKEESDHWVDIVGWDAVGWETCQAGAPEPCERHSQEGWEVIRHCNPWTGEWVAVSREEAEQL